ncbi:hypothetical protein [Acidipila sp. EB88]|uniref:hypothetical protein n=1 Tax=Acidipila sp. EB88 TaxID=2305226 RepID=UPI000F5F4DFE|nr:hypothetical protein [Acidipila sp. EB88]RRA50444.1 hypothetical protein D1Y84_00065 [Acidipila sp. EB88]
MNITPFENALWASGFGANVVLLCLLLVQKERAKPFPFFMIYMAYEIIETLTLFWVSRAFSSHAYFIWYWAFAPLDYIFQLGIIYDLARDVLRPTGTWIHDARKAFLLWSLTGLLLATVLALAMTPPNRHGLTLWSARSSLLTSLLTCEVFLAMSASASRLGLQWNLDVMAIGRGFTVWALVGLAADVAHFATGWSRTTRVFDEIRNVTFLGALIFWTINFALPERRRSPIAPEMRAYLAALHQQVQYEMETLRSAGKHS